MKSKKMGMKSSFVEPNKELKFGGKPMKYGPGGEKKAGDKTYTKAVAIPEGFTSNYKGEVFDADGKKVGRKVAGSSPKYVPNERNAGSLSQQAADYINRSRGTRSPYKSPKRDQAEMDKSNAEMASEADKRMAKLAEEKAAKNSPRAKAQNTPQGSSAKDKQGNVTTSQTRQASGSGAGNAPKSTPRPARMQEAAKGKTAKSVQGSGAKAELQTRSSAPKQAAAETKSEPTSKRASRINRRTEKVEARKSTPSRMDRKADRINKRADRVESRKAKKSEVSAAKARLKAARRLQDGGLKTPSADQKGLKKLPTSVRNKMGYKKYGGAK